MTSSDLRDILIAGTQQLRAGFLDLMGNNLLDLLLEFPVRRGAIDRDAEVRFAARVLKQCSSCRAVLVFNNNTVRVCGIRPRKLQVLLDQASELGAARWKLLS